MSRSITDIMNAWYGSSDEVGSMARDMTRGGMFDNADLFDDHREVAYRVLDFIEKPWHWDREHAWWVANEWPDDEETWQRGIDTGWEVK